MEIKHDYSCGKQEAYKKIDNLLEELQTQYSDMISNSTKKWNSLNDKMEFSFKVKGFKIVGDVNLYDNRLILNGKLPFAARIFQGKIKSTIEEKLDELF